MDLSSNVFKAIVGVGAASVTAIATGIGIDQNNKKVFQKAVSNIKGSEVGQSNWFGGGLFEFLEDQDIVFEIQNDNDSKPLTEGNFYIDKSPKNNLVIRVKVLVSENSDQLKTSESGKVKISHLKALKEDKDWTWSCNIKLSALIANKEYELKDKDKFLNNKKDGFFDVLTKDLTKEENREEITKWKEIKKGFVKNCSDFSKQANKPQNELENAWPIFYLWEKTDDTDVDKKLYFEDSTTYNAKKWFGEDITVVRKASS